MIDGFILALQFLTRLPVNIMIDFNNENMKKSFFFYPLVGMIIGGILYLINRIFQALGAEVAALFTVLGIIVITGGLHLDGLSDTCDGFFSNKDRERMLEIMSDSRVGAFGVISLIIIILFKYILYKNVALEDRALHIFIFSLGNSKFMQAYTVSFKESAKKEGMGQMFKESKPEVFTILSGLVYGGILIYFSPYYLIPLAINFLVVQLIYAYSFKKIGGFTGDILGSIAEIGEVTSLISFLGVIKWI